MEKLNDILLSLINGNSVNVDGVDVIGEGGEFIPIIKRSIGYIVGGLVFNDKGEILLTQESKRSCYGKWYLPMGRMEPGENILEGAKREVVEETGLITEALTLLVIESGGSNWFRFIFIMKQIGGKLKTKEDIESIKADWFHPHNVLNREVNIRSSDILPVIKRGLEYQSIAQIDRPIILPVIKPHKQMIYRIVLISLTQEGDLAVLVNIHNSVHLPCCLLGEADMSFMVTIFNLFKNVFGRMKETPKVCGILNVEHCGKPSDKHDGMCITTLVQIDNIPKFEGADKHHYDWHIITLEHLRQKLKQMLKDNKVIVPFTDVHAKVR